MQRSTAAWLLLAILLWWPSPEVTSVGLRFRCTLPARRATGRIVIHHAGAPHDVGAADLHRYHLGLVSSDGLRYAGIQYHYVVRLDGTVEVGRPEWALGAHAGESINPDSIGICLAGDLNRGPPTVAQMFALLLLVRDILERYGDLAIIGHSDVWETACPGRHFPWGWFRANLPERPLPRQRPY